MTPLMEATLTTLRRRGTTEIRFLARTIIRATRSKKTEETIVEKLLREALAGKSGIRVTEYPAYALRVAPEKVRLPRGKYVRAALIALQQAREPQSLTTLVQCYNARYAHGALFPEYWMWRFLADTSLSRIVIRSGALCIGLGQQDWLKPRKQEDHNSIANRLDEKSLETLLASRPDLIEPGLTVFQRQSRIPVGVIDLLCVDRKRNYVVVEIKRPATSDREIVGQITTYMGWVRKNIAAKGQTVRGVIVIGKSNQKLNCSLETIPNVSLRTFF